VAARVSQECWHNCEIAPPEALRRETQRFGAYDADEQVKRFWGCIQRRIRARPKITSTWIVCVAAAAARIRCQQMGLAGSVPLRQYVPSMLTRRSRSSRSSIRAGAVRGASHHFLSLSGVGVFLALFAQGLASCGSDDSGDACEANALRACSGPAMCAGTQTCASDGSGYSECSCGSGSAGAAGASSGGSGGGSNGGAAGSGGGGAIDPVFDAGDRAVGSPCNTSADCPEGPNGEALLTCITPTSTAEFGTGSPQGGYCTAACQVTEDCQALDGLSACGLRDEAGNGYCIGLCQPGATQDAIKCNADRAQACFEFPDNPNLGACFPVCQNDAACGAGQFCDFGATGLGLCVTTPPPGGDVGAACVPVAPGQPQTDCKSGVCVTLINPDSGEDAGSFCSANCTFGLVEGCGFARDQAEGTRDAVCIRPQLDNGGGGDVGYCFELCDVDADCAQANAGWVCVQDLTPDGQELVGRLGECVPPGLAGTDGGIVVDAGN
jgi:hypothetical protein